MCNGPGQVLSQLLLVTMMTQACYREERGRGTEHGQTMQGWEICTVSPPPVRNLACCFSFSPQDQHQQPWIALSLQAFTPSPLFPLSRSDFPSPMAEKTICTVHVDANHPTPACGHQLFFISVTPSVKSSNLQKQLYKEAQSHAQLTPVPHRPCPFTLGRCPD